MITNAQNIEFSNPKGFIVLEGPNGSGKSTLSRFLAASLNKMNIKTCQTFEPGATEVGKNIRQIVLGQSSESRTLTPLAELLLFSADRNMHAEQIIKPSLAKKEFVICDRFFYSTMAFQGYGRGYPLKQIEDLTSLAIGSLRPDLVLLLDLPPQEGLARTSKRASSDPAASDSFENEELAFHHRLRDGFLRIAEECTDSFIIIDAAQSVEDVQQQAWAVVEKLARRLI